MRADKANISGMSTRQKVTAGVFILIVIVIVWQLIGLFRGGSSTTTSLPAISSMNNTPGTPPAGPLQPPMTTPKIISEPKQPAAMTQAEVEMLQKQKQMEAEYINALNELQVLRLSREIAETNEAIAKSKLETVTAQKDTVALLTPPPVPQVAYSQALTNPAQTQQIQTPPKPSQTTTTTTETTSTETVNYSVISVSQIQNKWSAVVGYQGTLYQVTIGDVLPADQSTVVAIDKTGIILEKNGSKRKLSLVSII